MQLAYWELKVTVTEVTQAWLLLAQLEEEVNVIEVYQGRVDYSSVGYEEVTEVNQGGNAVHWE